MGFSKKFGKALGKMVEPIPVVSDIAEAMGDLGKDIPIKPVADYHQGLKEGASAADLRNAEERARRERKAARDAQERVNRVAEERNRAVREAAQAKQEKEEWERRAAALDAERMEEARKRAAETEVADG